MHLALRNGFPLFRNERELRSAVESVCAGFGKVVSLTVLPASKAVGLQCTCILRLDSSVAEDRLRARLNVIEYGTDLLFFAAVDDAWTGPRS